MGAKVTIKDVAELAGVSKSTVSRYLNHGYISLEKQKRVREAIEKTGFKSNFFAKRLKTQESKLIGIVLPRMDSVTVGKLLPLVLFIAIGIFYMNGANFTPLPTSPSARPRS